MLALQVGCGPAGDEVTAAEGGQPLPVEEVSTRERPTEEVAPPDGASSTTSAVSDCEGTVEELVSTVYQDTYVTEESPDTSFATAERLAVDGSPKQRVYLNFNPSLDGRPVLGAKLRLWARDGASGGFSLHSVDYWQSANFITWNKPLPVGPVLHGPMAVVDEAWNEFDVTSVMDTDEGEDGFSFALVSTSGDGAVFTSREGDGGTRPPQLVLTLGPKCNYHGDGLGGRLTQATRMDFSQSESLVHASADWRDGGWTTMTRDDSGQYVLRRFALDGSVKLTRAFAQGNANFRFAVTPLGNLMVAADYSQLTLHGRLLQSAPVGSRNLLLLKLKPDGSLDWFMTYAPTGGTVSVSAVRTDANGSLVVAGDFRGQLTLGGTTFDAGATTPQQMAGFVARIGWDAQHLWSHAIPTGQEGTRVRALAVNGDGSVLVGGGLGLGAILGGTTATGAPTTPFIARYLPDGTPSWTRVLDGATGAVESAVATNVGWAFAFNLRGGFQFAGSRIQVDPPGWTSGLALAFITDSGVEAWAKLHGSPWATVSALGLGARYDGTLILAGRMGSAADLGGGYLGQYETPFLAHYGLDGEHRWSRTFIDPRVGWDESHPLNKPHFLMLSTGEPMLTSMLTDPLTVDGQTFDYNLGPFPLVMLRFN
ncbi:DNRLRE domain-containing protein [Pyxidicoccus fallax]|uniref:DNRLRE domain-containing protein n=1 Tax=Pyxidicoccus fallax TaxID=394095 RepID=A0A848LFC9_9BACT|nr:DNRLRE domain-containing protein [Pyxidicoccus fallax]NMO15615.1 DNRLRE domain-containing protein [Pyxidicoccus fallax]NPC77212.1 DNRLRE domain-containing protein [Pyxidicoccus fallax]